MRAWAVFLLIFNILFASGLDRTGRAQTAAQDTTGKSPIPTKDAKIDSLSGEMVLDVIEIKGRVEKPGVIIVPKRVEPKLKEVELERNFKREVQEGIGEIPKPEKELRTVEKVKSVKKIVERKRK